MQWEKSLLINEGMHIGPEEQNSKCEDWNVTDQSKQVVFNQFKENPESSDTTKDTSWHLFVLP